MVARTETRRNESQTETAIGVALAPPPQPLFVGLPGALPQGFAPLPPGFGFAPFGLTPFTAPGWNPYPASIQAIPPLAAPGSLATGPGIPVAVQDLGREVVATFEVPGIAPADLNIVVGTTSVTLRTLKPAANGRVYQGTFALPAEVLPSQAAARLEHGLLVLTLPRRSPTEEPRRVEVEA